MRRPPAAQRTSDMAKDVEFTQTIFIGKPAEQVWDALTSKDMVQRYHIVPLGTADLAVGGEIFYGTEDQKMITGQVIELKKPGLFSHSFSFAHNPGDPASVVRYEIEDLGEMSALHLTHDGFPGETQTFEDISGGWPVVLSGLKTVLETGEALPWPQPAE